MAFVFTRSNLETAITSRAGGVSPLTRAAQALMLAVGIVGTFSVTYFTMVEPDDGINAFDGLVAGLLFIASLGYIAAARKLALNDIEVWGAALGFAALHIVMSLVKAVGFVETDATIFLGLDVIIAALLLSTKPAEDSKA